MTSYEIFIALPRDRIRFGTIKPNNERMHPEFLTNKDRLCEQSEPQSYPIVGRARHVEQGLIYKQISFLNVRLWKFGLDEFFF